MTRLHSSDLVQFARKYRFVGGKLKRFRVGYRRGVGTLEVVLLVRPATRDLGATPKPVKLKLEMIQISLY